MKVLIKIFAMFIMMSFASVLIAPLKSTAQVSVSFQVFYDDLSPYGYWVDYPDYGYVWIPGYGSEFIPYSSNGYWVYTAYGWTWVSNYPWGWAPFHYGNWAYDNYYGWFWVPGNVWGPAWVSWRTGPGYYGWVPLAPYISYEIVLAGNYNPPASHWVFMSNNYMGRSDSYLYYSPRKSNTGYIDNSKVINNTYADNKNQTIYLAGPKREDVEKVGGKIKEVSIKEGSKHGQSLRNNELTVYKPEITKSKNADVRPTTVVDLKYVKPVSERKVGKQSQKNTEVKKEIEKKESVMKKEESKEKIIKEQPNHEKRIKQEQPPKMVEPKRNENKHTIFQPNNEKKIKQEQPPKMVEPKMNDNKNFENQPHKEMKRQEKPPRMVQPNTTPNQNPGSQPHHNQGGQQKRPR